MLAKAQLDINLIFRLKGEKNFSRMLEVFQQIFANFQAADKDFWCKRPQNLLNNITSIESWRTVSNSSENCRIFDYEWDTLSSRQINVNNSLFVCFPTYSITNHS